MWDFIDFEIVAGSDPDFCSIKKAFIPLFNAATGSNISSAEDIFNLYLYDVKDYLQDSYTLCCSAPEVVRYLVYSMTTDLVLLRIAEAIKSGKEISWVQHNAKDGLDYKVKLQGVTTIKDTGKAITKGTTAGFFTFIITQASNNLIWWLSGCIIGRVLPDKIDFTKSQNDWPLTISAQRISITSDIKQTISWKDFKIDTIKDIYKEIIETA